MKKNEGTDYMNQHGFSVCVYTIFFREIRVIRA